MFASELVAERWPPAPGVCSDQDDWFARAGTAHEQRPLSSHASQVQVMNGKVYFGVFHGAEIVNGELNVALRMAHLKLGADAGWRTARAARRRARGD